MQLIGYHDGGQSLGGTTDVKVTIANNIIAGSISFFKFRETFLIKGNHIGIGADNVSDISAYNLGGAISINDCNGGIIGGENENDKNVITNASGCVSLGYTGNTTISRNSFRCNTVKAISFNDCAYDRTKPYINITSVSATSIAGNSLPNSTIELFYNDDCGFICEGKTYIVTLLADANGNWDYTGTNCEYMVATATDSYGATSEFSQTIIKETDIHIVNSACGKANGSITGIQIISGTDWHWEDDKGKIISSDIDLQNVPAGTYVLKTSVGNNSCSITSNYYPITDIGLPDDPLVSITNISCGQSSGSLSVTRSDNYKASWLANDSSVVGTDYMISNLLPAEYFLQLTGTLDASCTKTYGPYEIKSEIANILDASHLSISNATCGKPNGSITGIQYSATITADTYLEWEDENGKRWSLASLDLSAVPAGKYRVKLKTLLTAIRSPRPFIQ